MNHIFNHFAAAVCDYKFTTDKHVYFEGLILLNSSYVNWRVMLTQIRERPDMISAEKNMNIGWFLVCKTKETNP